MASDPNLKRDRSAYYKAWAALNKDRVDAARARWKAANPDFNRVYARLWMRAKRARLRKLNET